MKRNTLVLGFIFILLGGLLPQGAHAQAGPPEFVEIFGHKASATSLLARLKDPGNVAMIKQADQILAQQGFQKQAGFNVKLVKGLVRIELAAGAAANAMNADDLANHIRQLKASGAFHYVEPDWIVTVSQAPVLPTDTGFTDGTLWGLRNTGQNGGTAGVDVNAVPAWAITTGSPTVIVGVVDTGIRYTHQDLAANMWRNPGEIAGNGVDDDGNGYVDDVFGINGITNTGNPMDDNNHGSHCAGTIAATANNAGLHVGVAYNARLMGLKFLSASGSGATGDAIKCIDYGVAKGAHILSNSWGGGGFSQALADSIAAANAAGVLFVAAAGNSSANNDTTPNYPSNYDSANVVAVAAVDRTGALASFSSYGATTVDLGAPGVAITSSTAASDTSYASFDGTSMATPHVAGVAALLKSRYPSAGVVELKNRLLASTRPLASLAGRTVSGGIVNAHGALTVAADGVLELRASAAVSPLSAGVTTAFFVTVTDLTPVLGATVSGALGTAPAVAFLDNGVAPDVTANDGVYSANLPVPSTGTSVTLNVTASAGGAPATGAFPFAIVNPPVNDNFANRILLAAGTTQTTGTNRLSSRETGEPLNPSVAGGRTVWWEWVAATSGSATITTVGSSYDTTLAIYSGSGTLGSLVHLGSNDDAIGLASSVTFTATTGQRYYVQVDGFSGDTGDITLNYPSPAAVNAPPSIVTPPVGAILVEGDPLSLSVTASGTLPLSYQWRLNGTPIGGATSATYSVAAVAAAHAGSYTVTITNTFGTITGGPAVVVVDPISVRPSNDAFAAAEVLPGATGRVNGTNQRASGETGEPNHAGASTPLESVWYRWTAPANGTLAVDTYGSSLDTTLAVYTGTAVNALTLRGSNNDSGGLQSFVSVSVTAGQVLSIAVDGVGTLESIFSLNYHFQPAVPGVPNDAFANRTVVAGAPGTITGSNIGATEEAGEPVHSPLGAPQASVWWAWTAPASGVAVIDTLGSNFDTVLAVYTGSSVAALTPVASNDDAGGPQSRLTFPCVAGTSYAIAVDGRGTAEGNIALRIVSGASEPEIGVEEPVGTGLVDGTSTVNFGSVVTTGSASRVFTVRNTGGAALTSLALSVTGANSGDYTITTQPSAPLAGGGVTTFTVRFAPGAPGARSAALRIASNDADENPFDIALTGNGTVPAPEIAVEQPAGTNLTDGVSTVNFGASVVSGTASRTFTVRNTGNATLSGVAVTIGGTNAADFTVTTPPTATVAAGANTTFTVRFSPGGTGARTATLAISSNDADENPFDLTLNGVGIPLAGTASLFANSTYVDTSAGGEMENTRTALTGLGYVVTTFTGIADTDWNAAFTADVVIIPEFEIGTPSLAPAAIAAINAQLSSGKGLVVMGASGSNEQTFLNSIRGWALVDSGSLSSGTIAKVSGVPGFVNSPASLNALNATFLVSTASLPAGSVPVYQTGTSTAVFANGQIAYLGYDWFAGQDAGWSAVLGDAIAAVTIPPGPPTAPPVITSPLTAAAFVNVPFQYAIRATGSPTSYGATGLPTGLTVNTVTGVISGSVATAGTYPITISATNIIGPTTATLTLTVRTGFFDDFDPGIDAPLWSAFGGTVTANTIGQAAGSGSTGNSLHFAGTGSRFATTAPFDTRGAIEVRFLIALGNGSAPGWENVDSGEEVVLEYSNDGTTFVQIGGPYSHRTWTQVTIPVPAGARTAATRFRWRQLANSGDGFDNWAIEDAMISVVNPPVITSAGTATGTIGVAFNYQITATNSPTSFGAAGLPAGLSVNTSTGLISGTPTASGSSTVSLSATNAGGTGTATLSLTVRSTIESWRLFYFGTATGFIGNLQDFDHDGVLNIFEFGFGTDPTVRGGGPLQYNGTFAGGGTIGATGQPITVFEPTATGIDYRALFVRRVDHVAAGLTYTPQFSADLQTWVPSAVVPTELATDGTHQIVSVPYPPFVGGKKARFFRISVSIAP